VPIPVCGNGKLEAGEQCDDGNVAANDGCSESCQLENGDGAILVSKGAGTADYSAMLDVNSTQRGILIPRMTTAQRTAIKAPATGLMVFDATYNSFWYFGGNSWKEIKSDLLNAGFSASIPSATQNTSPGAPAFVAFPSEDFDDGGDNYNTGSSSYTVPSTGVYEFSATVSVNINASPAATSTYSINVYQSVGFTSIPIGSSTLVIPANYTGNATVSATGTVKLTAGNGGLVRVTITSSANTSAQQIVSGKFSGHRVY
jgi:cysteine-rich repeat protein